MDDELKLQKMVFISEKKMITAKIKALNYNFFRWQRGPYSAEISKDLTSLLGIGLLEGGKNLRLTSTGLELLNSCEELFSINKRFLTRVNNTVKKYAKYDPRTLMREVYQMTLGVPKKKGLMRVEDVPMGTLLLFKLSDANAEHIFEMDESWTTSLELAFDLEAVDALSQAYSDAEEGRAREFRIQPN